MANPKKADAVANALHAVTAGSAAGQSGYEMSQRAEEAQRKQPPVDNAHIAPGATKFTEAEIAANKSGASVPAPTVQTGAPRPKVKGNAWRLKARGNLHREFEFTAQRGHLPEDVMLPEYWADMAMQFTPFDEVTILCEDGSWRAHLQVIACDKQWAKMYLLNKWDFTRSYDNMPKTLEEEYEVSWTIMGKYAVVKKSMHGHPPLKDGFQTRHEAYQWLDGHLKTLNA